MNLGTFLNATVITGIVRLFLGSLGSLFIAKGWGDATSWQSITGDIMGLLAVVLQGLSSSDHAVKSAAIANEGKVAVPGPTASTSTLASAVK